jgi:hypothetical protein
MKRAASLLAHVPVTVTLEAPGLAQAGTLHLIVVSLHEMCLVHVPPPAPLREAVTPGGAREHDGQTQREQGRDGEEGRKPS